MELMGTHVIVVGNGACEELNRTKCVVNAASSTGRSNTIQCIDSTILPRENHLFGCAR